VDDASPIRGHSLLTRVDNFLPRDALTKMKDVYVKNPQMGDPASVDPRLSEIALNVEKLQFEAQKFEVGSSAEEPAATPI